MKNTLRITLAAAAMIFVFGSSNASAQKFGYINSEEVLYLMPDMDSVKIKMEAVRKDFADQYELMTVEYNNKVNDYQKSMQSMTDAGRQLKEQELQKLAASIQEFGNSASEAMEEERYKLLAPLAEKAQNAVTKIAKAQGMTAVFSSAALVYIDDKTMVDLLPLVKPELGIK